VNRGDGPLLEFPCEFPLKIIGRRSDDLAQQVVAIVLTHAPDFRPETVEMRVSGAGNYLALTCTIQARSRSQLDDLYRALTAHPAVKVVL
jgi:putative lipoic acid-binding regulatory protein